jgi:chitin disaccharide deacetylase
MSAKRTSPARARIRLATQGDDLGMNHSTNLAFVEAYRKGLLRNAALLVPCPAVEEAAKLLAKEKGLCISLHTCMNAEWDSLKWGPVAPIDKVRSLVDKNGMFHQTTTAFYKGRPRTEHILTEIQAQLDRARELGFTVTFADAHMGWSWILRERGKEHLFEEWRRCNGLLRHKRYGWLRPVNYMVDPVERLMLQLERAAPGQYWVGGHPAYNNAEMRKLGHPGYEGDIVGASREWERRIFTDRRLLAYCRNRGIVAIRHDEAR